MEWRVIEVIYVRTTGHYLVILRASALKMIAEVSSGYPVKSGDILYPVMNALYLLNNNVNLHLKVISASAYSATQWNVLKNNQDRQTTDIARNI